MRYEEIVHQRRGGTCEDERAAGEGRNFGARTGLPIWDGSYWLIPPSPPVQWNHRVSGKSRKNLWATISCRQNPDVKELRACASGQVPESGRNAISAHHLGSDDDRAITVEDARSDVTRGCEKVGLRCRNS